MNAVEIKNFDEKRPHLESVEQVKAFEEFQRLNRKMPDARQYFFRDGIN